MMIFDLLTFNTGIELVCLLTAIYCLRQDKEWAWKRLIIYLFITLIIEMAGAGLKKHRHSNELLYNISLLFDLLFMCLTFGHLFSQYIKIKKLLLIIAPAYLMLYVFEAISHGMSHFHELTYDALSIGFVIASLYYFYLLLNDSDYIDLRFSPWFWWVAGTLLFYFGSTAVNLFRGKLSHIQITATHHLPYFLYIALNLILYGCWMYSFICRKWQAKLSK